MLASSCVSFQEGNLGNWATLFLRTVFIIVLLLFHNLLKVHAKSFSSISYMKLSIWLRNHAINEMTTLKIRNKHILCCHTFYMQRPCGYLLVCNVPSIDAFHIKGYLPFLSKWAWLYYWSNQMPLVQHSKNKGIKRESSA